MLYDLNSNIEIHKFELSIPEIKEDKKRGVAPWLVQT